MALLIVPFLYIDNDNLRFVNNKITYKGGSIETPPFINKMNL